MKKEWSNPNISETGVQQTKEDVQCPYQEQNGQASTLCIFTSDKCCKCCWYSRCKLPWKYKGPCAS